MPARTHDPESDDPLTRALAPPRNEKPAVREARLHAEREAKKRSDLIDEDISRQRADERKGMRPVKILLLGQSESGKSTTLKNFQLMNSRQAFRSERDTWRAVIQLNVLRSVRIILDTLTDVLAAQADGSASTHDSAAAAAAATTHDHPHRRSYPETTTSSFDSVSHLAQANAIITVRSPSPPRGGIPNDTSSAVAPHEASPRCSASMPRLSAEHTKLRLRLAALMPVEDELRRRLAASAHSEPQLLGASATNESSGSNNSSRSSITIHGDAPSGLRRRPRTGGSVRRSSNSSSSGSRPSSASSVSASLPRPAGRLVPLSVNVPLRSDREIAVNSALGWKGAISRILSPDPRANASMAGEGGRDPGRVLAACVEDVKALWADPVVRRVLEEKQLRLEEMSGFFLDSLDRVTSSSYVPTDDDILRARLKTLGVSEYRFTFRAAHSMYHDWRVYDVGGHRSLRAAWAPFFDDMSGIIFLAPVSCFDQVLEEDANVNRIEDSVLLYKSVVSNPLLAKTNLVLFLNKCDILKTKLASGIRFAKYVVSYGDRPNDFDSVSKYLKRKFSGLLRDYSPEPRPFYCHLTSVTDTKTTFTILESVQDMVVRANLKASHLVD